MKKVLLSFIFMFSVGFIFSQSADLEIYNYSGQDMFVWVGSATTCAGPGAAGSPVLIPNGGSWSFAPLGPPTDSWVGFKCAASLTSTLAGPYGKFHSPCFPCGGVDIAVGCSVQWDTPGGCFAARILP